MDAYLLEGRCDWSGAVVDQSVPDYVHQIELAQFEGGTWTAWHQARVSRLIAPAAAPVKVPRQTSRLDALRSFIGRGPQDGGYRVDSKPRWVVPWPAAIGYVGAVEHLSEKQVAAAFTSAGGKLGPGEQAKRDATVAFMKATEADAKSAPPVGPPWLPE